MTTALVCRTNSWHSWTQLRRNADEIQHLVCDISKETLWFQQGTVMGNHHYSEVPQSSGKFFVRNLKAEAYQQVLYPAAFGAGLVPGTKRFCSWPARTFRSLLQTDLKCCWQHLATIPESSLCEKSSGSSFAKDSWAWRFQRWSSLRRKGPWHLGHGSYGCNPLLALGRTKKGHWCFYGLRHVDPKKGCRKIWTSYSTHPFIKVWLLTCDATAG